MRAAVNMRGVSASGKRRSSLTSRTNLVPQTNLAPKISDREAAEAFTPVIIGFTAKQLASASGRTVEAAKEWIAGTRMPSGASLLNLARSLPCVLDWINAQSGYDPAARAGSQDATAEALRRVARQQGPEADVARAILRELARGEGG